MNKILFKSALYLSVVHIIIFLNNPIKKIIIVYLIGLMTSLLNHKYTNNKLKYLDRLTMYICFIINVIVVNISCKIEINIICNALMILASVLYLKSKKNKKLYYI